MRDLDFSIDGAALHAGAALTILAALDRFAERYPIGRAGTRLHDDPALSDMLRGPQIRTIVERHLGVDGRPVRAILFDKSPLANWTLGWHQDRTIIVQARHPLPGYGPWSVKAGLQHVEPPFAVIEAMVTLRFHLDDVPADNAPLLISPGSHRVGRLPEATIDVWVARLGEYVCLAERGDIWAYATPIVHASAAAAGDRRRRVLQVDFSTSDLPAPLAWRGVG